MGNIEAADLVASEIALENPLDLISQWELRGREKARDDFALSQVENLLEMATFYGNCGSWKEAIEILSLQDASTPKKEALIPCSIIIFSYYYFRF